MGDLGVIVPAAGQGQRMGAGMNKQFMLLAGCPIIVHTLKIFQISEHVSEIVVVGAKEELSYLEELVHVWALSKVSAVIAGGVVRQASVYAGLKALRGTVDKVLIHDGARPLLTPFQLEAFLAEAEGRDAVTIATPLKDTVKRIDGDNMVIETPPRAEFVAVQTPQLFRKELILQAHAEAEKRGYIGTDDASLAEWIGHPVKAVLGPYENLKITTPDDLWQAEAIWEQRQKSLNGG